ncbi:MAG: hypothetical protein HGA53_10215, partial [Anaerolineaceae bacterium]|nr:hypothetical protein [Anaerolineaceae bacterium]
VERYGLSKKQIGILMGQLAQYEIGNLVNPNYSSACLMSKEFLDNLFSRNNTTGSCTAG